MSLFFTGFLQVFLVAINTLLISKQQYIGVFIISFFISFIWSFNIKKVAFGNMNDRLIYSTGAAIGGLSGLFLGVIVSKYLHI